MVFFVTYILVFKYWSPNTIAILIFFLSIISLNSLHILLCFANNFSSFIKKDMVFAASKFFTDLVTIGSKMHKGLTSALFWLPIKYLEHFFVQGNSSDIIRYY